MKNDNRIDGVFKYMFIYTGKIVSVLGKELTVMTKKVSFEINLSRQIYKRLLSKG